MRPVFLIAIQAAALGGSAIVCAIVSNALARPERRLAWTSVPPVVALAAPAPAPAPSQPLQVAPPAGIPSSISSPAAPRPRKLAQPAVPAPAPSPAFSPVPSQPIREIDSTQAMAAFRAKTPFLDARRSAEYALGHVKGAWSLPVWEAVLDARITEFEAAATPPPEGPLVLYCSGGSCEDSHLLASKLFQLGYRNLLIYRDGYPDWIEQGRPVSTGATR